MNENETPDNDSVPAAAGELLNLEDDTPMESPSCSLDGTPCEACQ